MAGQLALNQLIQVRALAPDPLYVEEGKMDIENTKWPELEILLSEYIKWYHGYGAGPLLSLLFFIKYDFPFEGSTRIKVIKKVRQVVGCGLGEAKELVDLFEKSGQDLLNHLNKAHPDHYTPAEKHLLELAGFSFVKNSIRTKSRMLRVG